MNKLWHAIGNGSWQLLPSVSTLLLSLVIVRLFNAGVWGTMVSILVIQQITNGILSWGNKDFLQRELAFTAAGFNALFTALFAQRLLLLALIMPVIWLSGLVPSGYFFGFSLLVIGRFVQQSFDVIILKERKFQLAIALEILSLAGQLSAILLYPKTDPQALLMLFWIPALLKSLILTVVFRNYFEFGKTAKFLLPPAFFFAMLSLSGLVHGKIDLLLISRLLDPEILGVYQIITAVLWNIQSVAMYVSGPYVPNFYRLNESSQQNYALFLRRIGFLIVPLGVSAMAALLYFGFGIRIGWSVVGASLLFGIMSFIYLPWILQLNRNKQEYKVLLINIGGTLLLAGLILAATAFWKLTLENILWLLAIHQAAITAIAYAANKSPKVCLQP